MNSLRNKWADADFAGRAGIVALALFLTMFILGVSLVPLLRAVVGLILGVCLLAVFFILAVHGLFTLFE